MKFQNYLVDFMSRWDVIEQMKSPYNTVLEVLDSDIKYYPIKGGSDYTVGFMAYGDKFIFMANEDSGEKGLYSLLFFKANTPDGNMFKSVGDGLYKGKVFAGIISSLKGLMNKEDVKGFFFSSDDPKLIKFYDKSIKLTEKRFSEYKFDERIIKNNTIYWVYRKK